MHSLAPRSLKVYLWKASAAAFCSCHVIEQTESLSLGKAPIPIPGKAWTAAPNSRPVMMQPGQLYNAEDGRKALRDVFALGLFDNVQIFPKPNQRDESKVG